MVVPAPDGKLNPLVLVAAELAGVDEIYRVGGAQAIAALAYGTETIAPVVKIVGPGNAYVAAAKRQVFGQVGIDMIAGPSEVVVIADKDNDPAWIAADLLAQAEHDAAAQSILITDDAGFARAVAAAVETQLATLAARGRGAGELGEFWRHHPGREPRSRRRALVDRLGAGASGDRHGGPRRAGGRIRNAGAIFLGRYTPEVIGDYVAGSEPCAAHRAQRPLCLRPRRARLHEAHLDPQARRRRALSALGPAAMTLAERRGARSPSPLRRHPAERAGLAMAEEQQQEELSPEQARLVEVTLDAAPSAATRPTSSMSARSPSSICSSATPSRSRRSRRAAPTRCICRSPTIASSSPSATQKRAPIVHVMLSLSPFRRLVKDYFLMCESYYQAIKTAPPSRIEAIDMGRRGLHDEGSRLLMERLKGKVHIDIATARRLFTLICALHWKG